MQENFGLISRSLKQGWGTSPAKINVDGRCLHHGVQLRYVLGDRPNTVSGSTGSNTELGEFSCPR